MVENCDECDDKHVVPGTCSFNEEPAVRPVVKVRLKHESIGSIIRYKRKSTGTYAPKRVRLSRMKKAAR